MKEKKLYSKVHEMWDLIVDKKSTRWALVFDRSSCYLRTGQNILKSFFANCSSAIDLWESVVNRVWQSDQDVWLWGKQICILPQGEEEYKWSHFPQNMLFGWFSISLYNSSCFDPLVAVTCEYKEKYFDLFAYKPTACFLLSKSFAYYCIFEKLCLKKLIVGCGSVVSRC